MTTTQTNATKAADTSGVSEGWAFLILVGILLGGGFQLYDLNRDLDSIKDRAQIAANPIDMLTYMQTLAANMTEHQAASGHTALLLKTPANDLALHYQAVNSVIERLGQIQTLSADSDAYQSGLDDVRGIIREMPEIASGVFWVKFGWWLGIVALVCFGRIVAN